VVVARRSMTDRAAAPDFGQTLLAFARLAEAERRAAATLAASASNADTALRQAACQKAARHASTPSGVRAAADTADDWEGSLRAVAALAPSGPLPGRRRHHRPPLSDAETLALLQAVVALEAAAAATASPQASIRPGVGVGVSSEEALRVAHAFVAVKAADEAVSASAVVGSVPAKNSRSVSFAELPKRSALVHSWTKPT